MTTPAEVHRLLCALRNPYGMDEGYLRAVRRDAADLLEELLLDAQRLDYLETIIRDGSYASIINDVVEVCQASYRGFGPGPALRSALDAVRRPI